MVNYNRTYCRNILIVEDFDNHPRRQKKGYPESEPEERYKAGRLFVGIFGAEKKEGDFFFKISPCVSKDKGRNKQRQKRQ